MSGFFVFALTEIEKIKILKLAPTYSPFKESTIGDGGLNSCLPADRSVFGRIKFKFFVLAPTYSPFKESTIGDGGLNFRVRNENGCTPSAKAPTQRIQI